MTRIELNYKKATFKSYYERISTTKPDYYVEILDWIQGVIKLVDIEIGSLKDPESTYLDEVAMTTALSGIVMVMDNLKENHDMFQKTIYGFAEILKENKIVMNAAKAVILKSQKLDSKLSI